MGKLIALEGVDGSGTTTQAKLLSNWLNETDRRTVLTNEPNESNPIGKLIRSSLKKEVGPFDHKTMALLFAAERREHYFNHLNETLKHNHVVTDRSVYSSLAYQSIFNDPKWVAEINKFAVEPDLVIYLRVPVLIALERVSSRKKEKEIYETLEIQKQVAYNYDSFFDNLGLGGYLRSLKNQWRIVTKGHLSSVLNDLGRYPTFATISSLQPVEVVHEQIKELVGLFFSQ